MLKTKQGVFENAQEAIDAQWDTELIAMDWQGMENTLRHILKGQRNVMK